MNKQNENAKHVIKVYKSWTRLWFEEYILKKKSLQELSEELNIRPQLLQYHFKYNDLPLRTRRVAIKNNWRKKIIKQKQEGKKNGETSNKLQGSVGVSEEEDN